MAVGGSLGSLARVGTGEILPPGRWDWPTLAVNALGSAALAAVLVLAASQSARHHRLRLTLGTGVMGGFTTFSAFVLHGDVLARDGRAGASTAYLTAGLASMILACAGGATIAHGLRERFRERG